MSGVGARTDTKASRKRDSKKSAFAGAGSDRSDLGLTNFNPLMGRSLQGEKELIIKYLRTVSALILKNVITSFFVAEPSSFLSLPARPLSQPASL